MTATFKAELDPKAGLFRQLMKEEPWFRHLLEMENVYAEVRKGNIVDIYFEGGRMAELSYKRGRIIATCHEKYLGVKDGKKYVDCLEVIKKSPALLMENIRDAYSEKSKDGKPRNPEDISEKKIQGTLICRRNPIYLDSEFAHRFQDDGRSTIRFDLVAVSDNKLQIIELKRIKDNRMLNDDDSDPEIISQMNNYSMFIDANAEAIVEYYKKLYLIKRSLGLPVPPCDIETLGINRKPHLIICDTYTHMTKDRKIRIKRMSDILDRHSDLFNYCFFNLS